MVEQPTGEISAVAWKFIISLASVIVSLSLVIVKLAKVAWTSASERLQDHRDFEAQMNVVRTSVLKQKGQSP